MKQKEFILLFLELTNHLANTGTIILKEENKLKTELRELFKICEENSKK